MNRDVICQDTHRNMLIVLSDTNKRTDDDSEDAHSTNKALSPHVDVYVPREVIMSPSNLDSPAIESTNPYTRTNDATTREDHNLVDTIDPGNEVCVPPKVTLCKGTDALKKREVPSRTSERTTDDNLRQPTETLGGNINSLPSSPTHWTCLIVFTTPDSGRLRVVRV